MENNNSTSEKVNVKLTCKHCGYEEVVSVNKSDLNSWISGTMIQKAMPYLTASQRELFISETCDKCWNNLFK